jgi:hypothetical protein
VCNVECGKNVVQNGSWECVLCILGRIMFRDPVFVSLIKPSNFSFKDCMEGMKINEL